ncbi:hypothetical protein HYQ46_003454 [Verticillium longisporum]|nr:hypothetical protein HYQ46_003454 [Verticillium longisporum]
MPADILCAPVQPLHWQLERLVTKYALKGILELLPCPIVILLGLVGLHMVVMEAVSAPNLKRFGLGFSEKAEDGSAPDELGLVRRPELTEPVARDGGFPSAGWFGFDGIDRTGRPCNNLK